MFNEELYFLKKKAQVAKKKSKLIREILKKVLDK